MGNVLSYISSTRFLWEHPICCKQRIWISWVTCPFRTSPHKISTHFCSLQQFSSLSMKKFIWPNNQKLIVTIKNITHCVFQTFHFAFHVLQFGEDGFKLDGVFRRCRAWTTCKPTPGTQCCWPTFVLRQLLWTDKNDIYYIPHLVAHNLNIAQPSSMENAWECS